MESYVGDIVLLIISCLITSSREDCLCDQLSGVCEYLCCCDSDAAICSAQQTELYTKYNSLGQCIEKNYGSQFKIPLTESVNKFIIIRVLGSVATGQYKSSVTQDLSSPSSTKVFSEILTARSAQAYSFSDLATYLQPEKRLINRITAVTGNIGFFVRDPATGNCIKYQKTEFETLNYQVCKPSTTQITSFRAYATAVSTASTAIGCIPLSSTYEILKTDLVVTSGSCTTFSLLTSAIGVIYSQSVPTFLVMTSPPNIFLGAAVYNDLTAVPSSKKPFKGYSSGQLLRLRDSSSSSSSSKGIILNSIYDIDGKCLQSNNINMLHPLQITFGSNYTASCTGQMKSDSYIHSLSHVGAFPEANPSYSLDWVSVTPPASSASACVDNLVISISYQKQGRKANPSFYVTAAQMYCFTNTAKSQSSFSVLFIEETQSSTYYLSSAPEVKSKLSRDVLYPFFEFNE